MVLHLLATKGTDMRLLLINPNTSAATTTMMCAIIRPLLPAEITLQSIQASIGAAMILDAAGLAVAASEVLRIGRNAEVDAIIVAAFGDPGVADLRAACAIPVIGIGEAAIRATAGRRFGIATTTPGLVAVITAAVQWHGFGPQFSGLRVPPGDPIALAADPQAQDAALAQAIAACISDDGADAVIIGGGPLGASAQRLQARYGTALIAPLPAAVASLRGVLG